METSVLKASASGKMANLNFVDILVEEISLEGLDGKNFKEASVLKTCFVQQLEEIGTKKIKSKVFV